MEICEKRKENQKRQMKKRKKREKGERGPEREGTNMGDCASMRKRTASLSELPRKKKVSKKKEKTKIFQIHKKYIYKISFLILSLYGAFFSLSFFVLFVFEQVLPIRIRERRGRSRRVQRGHSTGSMRGRGRRRERERLRENGIAERH